MHSFHNYQTPKTKKLINEVKFRVLKEKEKIKRVKHENTANGKQNLDRIIGINLYRSC